MKIDHKPVPPAVPRQKLKARIICFTAVVSFAAGSLVTGRLSYLDAVRADSNRVFQLLVYHTLPGKVPDLESKLRDDSKLQAEHGLTVVGYWIPFGDDPAWANTLVSLVAHPSREEAKKNWHAFHADPEAVPFVEAVGKLLEKVDGKFRVDEPYMHPADLSPMK